MRCWLASKRSLVHGLVKTPRLRTCVQRALWKERTLCIYLEDDDAAAVDGMGVWPRAILFARAPGLGGRDHSRLPRVLCPRNDFSSFFFLSEKKRGFWSFTPAPPPPPRELANELGCSARVIDAYGPCSMPALQPGHVCQHSCIYVWLYFYLNSLWL